jgi:hypothetical protein
MTTSEARAWRAARRAYEMGRVRAGLVRGLVVACLAAALAVACCGPRALAWMPLTWLAWAALEWRGGALRVGGVRGLVAGAVTLILPATWLRACCEGMEHDAACRAPETCAMIGALIGIGVAMTMPRVASAKGRAEGALGATVGALAVSAVRCTSLLGGEAFGLLLGLTGGLVAASAASAWLAQPRATPG